MLFTSICRLSGTCRQVELHGGSLPRRALDLYAATGLPGKTIDLTKPQAGSLANFLGGEERLEQARANGRVDTAALIGYGDQHELALQPLHISGQPLVARLQPHR